MSAKKPLLLEKRQMQELLSALNGGPLVALKIKSTLKGIYRIEHTADSVRIYNLEQPTIVYRTTLKDVERFCFRNKFLYYVECINGLPCVRIYKIILS